MRVAHLIVLAAGTVVFAACSSSGHTSTSTTSGTSTTGSSATHSSTAPAPVNHAATTAWISAVSADAKALKGQANNLQFDWNGVQLQDSQGRAYALQLDQIALYNLAPDAEKLATLLQTKAGHVASADAKYERDFGQAVGQWQHVAALAHAIKTAAQKYSSPTKTGQAIDAFQSALNTAESLWNSTVTTLWSAGGVAGPPTVDPGCSPTDKSACN